MGAQIWYPGTNPQISVHGKCPERLTFEEPIFP